jgi:hypothetical protein
MSQAFSVAVHLTAEGLLKGRDYSYLGVDLYTEHGVYGGKTFVVLCDNKAQRFERPLNAATVFAKMIRVATQLETRPL